MRTLFTTLSIALLFACSTDRSDVELKVNVGIPVRAPSHNLSKSFMSLMSITPGIDCMQDQVSLALYDTALEKVVATKKVLLRTNIAHTISYGNGGGDVDSAIVHLQSSSFLDEQPKILIPRDRQYEVGLMGTFYKPADVNSDGICDHLNYASPNIGWNSEAILSTTREGHTATVLSNGKVLVIGGYNTSYTNSVLLYDPIAKSWSTKASMSGMRAYHTATLLPSGKVLVAGGENGSTTATVELYDPDLNTWTTKANMNSSRSSHTATLMPDGKVLMIAGMSGGIAIANVELYDPVGNTTTSKTAITGARYYHTAIYDSTSGGVIVMGGNSAAAVVYASVDSYNVGGNTWSSLASMNNSRGKHRAIQLPSGKIIVIGGSNGASQTNSVEEFNISLNSWTNKTNLTTAREMHSATLLPNGKIMIAGGWLTSSAISSVEMYDPVLNATVLIGSLFQPRKVHTASLLPSGKVLIAGGYSLGYLDSVEVSETFIAAQHSTSLTGHSPVTTQSLSTGNLAVKIDVLHANPSSPGYTLQNPRHKDWLQINSGFTFTNGVAYLTKIDWMPNQNMEYTFSQNLNPSMVIADKVYIPSMFPIRLRFKFTGTYTACVSNIATPCSGFYEATIQNSGISTITANLISGTGSAGNVPTSTIAGSFSITGY